MSMGIGVGDVMDALCALIVLDPKLLREELGAGGGLGEEGGGELVRQGVALRRVVGGVGAAAAAVGAAEGVGEGGRGA